MMHLSIALKNPFTKPDIFKNLFNHYWLISKNKVLDLEAFETSTIIGFIFIFSTMRDAAGLYLEFGLLGYGIKFSIKDIRQWDYDKNDWEAA